MPAKETPEPAANWYQASPFSVITGWAKLGAESFFATQRILLNLVMRQNANTMTAIRERLAQVRSVPLDAMTEMAGEGVSNMIAAERVMLHLAQRENEILMGALQETAGGRPPGAAVTNAIRRSIDNLVDMQLHFLTIAAKQADQLVESVKAGKRFDGKLMPEIARESIETFVRAQKKFLDVIAEETSNWTAGVTNGKNGRSEELTELAREAAEAYIDAQKKVLDVFAQQGEVNLQTAGSIFEVMNPFQPSIFKEFSLNTVENFVTAEKALMDLVAKPSRAAAPGEPKTPKKPGQHKRAGAKRHTAAAGV
jgi:hypothetical protein